MASLPQQFCRNFQESSRLEWLETNGKGSFAMGTCAGVNTRRYHGLLVASLRPPVDRRVILSRLEEVVEAGDHLFDLSTCQYPGVVAPFGYRFLTNFRYDIFPHWRYTTPAASIDKELFLVQGENTLIVRYQADADVLLKVRPMLAFRDYHCLRKAGDIWPGEGPRLKMVSPSSPLEESANWYYNIEYLRELDRGLDFREDLFSPGIFHLDLKAGQAGWFVASLENGVWDEDCLQAVYEAEQARRAPMTSFDRAAEQFVVQSASGHPTIIAGYPWFTDWGRDTMISLPGLLIRRGKQKEARQILENFLQHLDRGVIPNRFPDHGESPEYNTVDATLWLFVAAQAYWKASADLPFLQDVLLPAAKEIFHWHVTGTHFGIRMDTDDNLLSSGLGSVQLTWMDAKVGDYVVTPRHGKPVEINALWINALLLASTWAVQAGETTLADSWRKLAVKAEESFTREFWNGSANCLYDVIGADGKDASIRPNQVIALSLPFDLVSQQRAQSILSVVETQLLTPFGLRSLSPADKQYRGSYGGSPMERDCAYHQGTVWPWLLGPYVKAYLKAFGRTAANADHCRKLLKPLLDQFDNPADQTLCVGSVFEVCNGDAPHLPEGAPAQAWSVGQLIEAVSEVAEIA